MCHAGARTEHLSTERGHRVLVTTRKGGRTARVPLAPRTATAVETYLAGRTHGPLLVTRTGAGMDRHAIWRLLRRLARDAVPDKAASIHPHDLRHAFVTLSLDAGASLRDVQDAAGHADPRTTRRYDRARHHLDRHPTYALAGLLT
ncbi:tyrosine-type recombinase/integrase [Quadrisphaera setariae]|uniref:Tyrosine-type recombinase/integrase n=1 Tax=Quadrisphaera setariae TaxID=2593304 RepID=A0A5C8Z213_9ACTN|nr:tyrosine-type recombinase/integrase [Quadrisphaera setariae]TXR51587.1 tyrosine-type recombinase/integrase [Quadrisphaera setariae]